MNMRRIFPEFAYGAGPREGCWWDRGLELPELPVFTGQARADVAIVGGGFTGLNAALTLAENGADVVLLEAAHPGWGASGRNAGFCCLGGGVAPDAWLDREYGIADRRAWRQCELRAIQHVEDRIAGLGLDVDRHSRGETLLAHRARDARKFEGAAESIAENYGVTPVIHGAEAFGDGFHGALTTPVGFALNPGKYMSGLVQACLDRGVRIFAQSPVTGVRRRGP